MSAAELHVSDRDRAERIERWRAEELERAGYDPRDAVALAARHDIDLHFAIDLSSAAARPTIGASRSCSGSSSHLEAASTARARSLAPVMPLASIPVARTPATSTSGRSRSTCTG